MRTSNSQPHNGLTVLKWHDDFASTPQGLVRYFDLKCCGCGSVWERVAPTVSKPTIYCDECSALQDKCDHAAQAVWDKMLDQQRTDPATQTQSFEHANGNRGVYALRDILFDHVRGAAELSRGDKRRLERMGFTVPAFGERKL